MSRSRVFIPVEVDVGIPDGKLKALLVHQADLPAAPVVGKPHPVLVEPTPVLEVELHLPEAGGARARVHEGNDDRPGDVVEA